MSDQPFVMPVSQPTTEDLSKRGAVAVKLFGVPDGPARWVELGMEFHQYMSARAIVVGTHGNDLTPDEIHEHIARTCRVD